MGFSVLMSVYRKEKPEYLAEALESVINQTLQADEIVLIEDGPIGVELKCVLDQYRERCPYLRIFQFQENVQLGRALAKGVELCSNELIARMDTDDIAMPDRFETQYRYMRSHPEVGVCGGWMEEFNDNATYFTIKRMPENSTDIHNYAKYRNPLNHMTVMFRKEAVIEAGNYQHFPLLEDYQLWCRMLVGGCVMHNLPKVLVKMRTNENLYERRGGVQYFKQYGKLRRMQRDMRMLSGLEYLLAMFLTAFMTLQPVWLRKLVYQRVLR